MNLSLSPETQKLLEERMRKGGYPTPEQTVRAGLAYLEQQELAGDFGPGALADLLAAADAEIDRGELLEGEDVFREIRELSKTRRGEAG